MRLFLESSNTAALEAGRSYLRIVGSFYAFFGLGLALYFASQGAGRMTWPVISSLGRMAVAITGALLFTKQADIGVTGIFAAISGAMLVYGAIIGLAVWFGSWRPASP